MITDTDFIEEILTAKENSSIPKDLLIVPFIHALWPWMSVARTKLYKAAGANIKLLETDAIFAVEKSLLTRFSSIFTSSFHLEMEVKKLQNELIGETSEERYLDFIERFLRNEGLRAFFQEYAWLAEHVRTIVSFWMKTTLEFLEHLQQDMPLLEETFNHGKSLGRVTKIQVDVGDTHQGGNAVRILTFKMGTKIVYKPKYINIVQTFNAFLNALNDLGLSPKLQGYKVIAKEAYGWEEFVEYKECQSLTEVENYYQRAGMLLCLMYLFEGKDAHFENIIASGEFPVLIDLETIMHSPTNEKRKKDIREQFTQSVFGTGLLPMFSYAAAGKKGADFSGLGGSSGERVTSQYNWEKLHSDEMTLIESEEKQQMQNTVKCEGKIIPIQDYIEKAIEGFGKMYQLIEKNRDTLFTKEGWLEKLGSCLVRYIARSTRFYYLLLKRLYIPQTILNEEQRENELKLLERLWADYGDMPHIGLMEEEKKALLQGDIPCFQTYPKLKSLYYGNVEVVKDYIELPSYEIVKNRLASMGDKARKEQELFIRQAFLATSKDMHSTVSDSQASFAYNGNEVSDSEILKYVEELCTKIRKAAFSEEDGALNWISLHPNPQQEQYSFSPIDETLYAGKSGIALLFAALFHMTKEKRWKQEALCTLQTIRKYIKDKQLTLGFQLGLGGMNGAGSIIYTLFHISKLLNLPELKQEAIFLAEEISLEEIKKDTVLDLLSGCSGLLLVLLSLYQEHKSPKILELIKACGEHLCEMAQEEDDHLFWKISVSPSPYFGFAHGSSGIGYALYKLYEIVPTDKFLKTAEAAKRWEQKHYNQEHSNWPISIAQKDCWNAWCHGSMGIGLGRLNLLQSSQKSHLQQELHSALAKTVDMLESPNGGCSLCCGILGRIELLHEASKNFAEFHPQVRKGASILLAQEAMKDPHQDPGLMKGAAGIGYTLLRLLDKEGKLPQVLLLS